MFLMGNFKFVFAFILLSGMTVFCMGQQFQGYFVEKTGTYSLQELTNALDKADLDHYRKMNGEVKLIFDQGAEVKLNSASSLVINGIPVKTISLIPESSPDDLDRRFSIMTNGMLAVLYPVKTGK